MENFCFRWIILLGCLIGLARGAPTTVLRNTPMVSYITARNFLIIVNNDDTQNGNCYFFIQNVLDGSTNKIQVYSVATGLNTTYDLKCSNGMLSFNEEDNLISFNGFDNNAPTSYLQNQCNGNVQIVVWLGISGNSVFKVGAQPMNCAYDTVGFSTSSSQGEPISLPSFIFPFLTPDSTYCVILTANFSNDDSQQRTGVICLASFFFPVYGARNVPINPLPVSVLTVPGKSRVNFLIILQDRSMRGFDVDLPGARNDLSLIPVTGYNGGSTSTLKMIRYSSAYLLISTISGVGFGTIASYDGNFRFSSFTGSQNYFFTPAFISISAGVIDTNVIQSPVRFWITTNNQLLRDVNGSMISIGNVDQSVIQGYSIKGATFISTTKMILLWTGNATDIQYEFFPAYTCDRYTNCEDCFINDPYYCGWVSNSTSLSCVQKGVSIITNINQCPKITSTSPYFGAVAVPKNVTLTGTNLLLQTLSSWNLYCIFQNDTSSFYYSTGTRLSQNSFNCTVPAQNTPNSVTITLSLSQTSSRALYARGANLTSNTYVFALCSDYDTASKCKSVLSELTDCGWCNSTSSCTPRTGCPLNSFTRTLFPSASDFTPLTLPTNNLVTINITGSNFVDSVGVNYTLHLFSSNKRAEVPDNEPIGSKLSYRGKVISRNLIQVTSSVEEAGSFTPALYSNGKLVSSSVVPVQITNCSSLSDCKSCRTSTVCNWCMDKCIPKLSSTLSGPCIQSNCMESLPSLNTSKADVKRSFDLEVSFWYPLNTSSPYYLTFDNSTFFPLDFDSDNQSATVWIPGESFTTNTYQPVIEGDNYRRYTSTEFRFIDCESETNCTTCTTEDGCIWTSSVGGMLQCVSLQVYPTATPIVCPIASSGSGILSVLSSGSSGGSSNGVLENTNQSSSNVIPAAVGGTIGGLVLLLLIILLVAVLLRRKKTDSYTLTPPQNFEMVVVSKDSEPSFNVSKAQSSNLSGLETVLLREGFPYAEDLNRLPTASELDGFGKFYIYIAFSKDKFIARDLLQRYIRIEIDKTKGENTIFRTTSNATQMFTAYAKVVGLEFLWNTLASPIHQIIRAGEQELKVQKPSLIGGVSQLEFDSEQYEEDPEFLEANIYQLLAILSKIFARIRKNIPNISPWIRLSIRDTRIYASKRFPASERKVVGSFLFLRYIVPAIISPHLYGITDTPPNEHAQRILVLVSRVMQNLANETMPSTKTEGMQKMDQFVADNIPILHTMYDFVTNYYPTEEDLMGSNINLPDGCRENSIVWIHNLLCRNRSNMSAATMEATGEFILPNEIPKKGKGELPK